MKILHLYENFYVKLVSSFEDCRILIEVEYHKD